MVDSPNTSSSYGVVLQPVLRNCKNIVAEHHRDFHNCRVRKSAVPLPVDCETAATAPRGLVDSVPSSVRQDCGFTEFVFYEDLAC